MNKNKHYLISDASRQVQVEAHVLRYWEDELGLPIPRNELGHRYYTEFHIQLFRQIKQLKEQGYQLKAIRGILGKVEENQKNRTGSASGSAGTGGFPGNGNRRA